MLLSTVFKFTKIANFPLPRNCRKSFGLLEQSDWENTSIWNFKNKGKSSCLYPNSKKIKLSTKLNSQSQFMRLSFSKKIS